MLRVLFDEAETPGGSSTVAEASSSCQVGQVSERRKRVPQSWQETSVSSRGRAHRANFFATDTVRFVQIEMRSRDGSRGKTRSALSSTCRS